MQHFGLTLELKDDPELIAQYKAYHADPLARATSGPWRGRRHRHENFSLGPADVHVYDRYRRVRSSPRLPRYVEQNPKAKEWDELMRTFQQQVSEAKEGGVVGQYGTRV